MWRGRRAALVRYGLASVAEWIRRGFPDSTASSIAEFSPAAVTSTQQDLARTAQLPSWLGDERLHRSHRSKLLAKDPAHYGPLFTDVPTDLDYYWPDPDASAEPEDGGEAGRPLWVVRPESTDALGRFLTDSAVGFGTESGVSVDATGQDLAGLRALAKPPGRRPTRALLALARLVTEVDVGAPVGVLVEQGQGLLLGEVAGHYEFRAGGGNLTHYRRVRWDRVLARDAVRPSYALQDVRPLFQVRLRADRGPRPGS
jgi:hypothetical protein